MGLFKPFNFFTELVNKNKEVDHRTKFGKQQEDLLKRKALIKEYIHQTLTIKELIQDTQDSSDFIKDLASIMNLLRSDTSAKIYSYEIIKDVQDKTKLQDLDLEKLSKKIIDEYYKQYYLKKTLTTMDIIMRDYNNCQYKDVQSKFENKLFPELDNVINNEKITQERRDAAMVIKEEIHGKIVKYNDSLSTKQISDLYITAIKEVMQNHKIDLSKELSTNNKTQGPSL